MIGAITQQKGGGGDLRRHLLSQKILCYLMYLLPTKCSGSSNRPAALQSKDTRG